MKLRFKLFIFTLLSVLILASASTFAVTGDTPPANAEIGNQATLEYLTGTGEHRTVVSNIVVTVINPVYGVDIDPPIHLTGQSGETIYYVHSVQNIGNVIDDIEISVTDIASNPNYNEIGSGTKYLILTYATGGLKPLANNTLKDVPAGATEGIVIGVQGNLPDSAQGEFKVYAKSIGAEEAGRTVEDYTIDNLTLSQSAIVNAYKGFSEGYADTKTVGAAVSEGATKEPFMATFYFHNSGGVDAGELTLTDTLDDRFAIITDPYRDGKSMKPSYVKGTGEATTINYNENGNIAIGENGQDITITIASGELTPQGSAQTLNGMDIKVSFWLEVVEGTLAGTIPNQGSYTYEDSTTGTSETKKGDTNVVTYTVAQVPGIEFDGEDIGTVEQGSLIVFRNLIENTGNAEDTFDISYIDNEFPAGSSFYLSHYIGTIPGNIDPENLNTYPEITLDDFDQRTPLIDTNKDDDGLVDTGIMQVGEKQIILLWVQLPLEALGTNIKVDKLGTSDYDPEEKDTARDQCDIDAVEVDITNNRYLGEGGNSGIGMGKGPEAAPVTELAINPGEIGYFNLYINNTAEYLSDEYTLDVSIDPTFETIELPEGIKVTLVSAQGAQVSGTEVIEPGGHENVRAKVQIDETALSGDHYIYFRARSPQTGAFDIKTDMIKIGVVRNLTILPKNTGTIYAGSSIVYPHTIKNGGNVIEGGGATSSKGLIKLTNTRSNHFSATSYWDIDENGILEKGIDPQLLDLSMDGIEGLDPGEEIDIFVEVQAANTATVGMENDTKVRLDVNKGIYKIFHPDVFTNDVTTIIEDELVIEKYQGYGTATSDGPDNPADFTKEQQTGDPEGYIYYKIVATNTGSTEIEHVAIEDLVPQYTTMVYAPQNAFLSTHAGKPSWRYGHEEIDDMKLCDIIPAEGGKGLIEADAAILGPNETMEVYFAVKIDGTGGDIAPDDDPTLSPLNPDGTNPNP